MTRGLLIPADGPVKWVEVQDVDHYQRLVGGWFDVVQIYGRRADMYVNDEGKIFGLAINERASMIADIAPGDVIRGDVVLVGPVDARGDQTDLPDPALWLLDAVFAMATAQP